MWENLAPNFYARPHNWFNNMPNGPYGNNFIVNKTDMLSYFTGLGDVINGIATNIVRPGAVAGNITSFGGRIGQHYGQESVLTFLANKFVYVDGTVAEPWQDSGTTSPGSLVEQFTDTRLFLPRYLAGQRLAECYRSSVRFPVRNLGVFCPFMRYV